jgi:PBP1b-binding outer membrane lipoprotein LpoB
MATYVRLAVIALLLVGCSQADPCTEEERRDCAEQWFTGMETELYCDCLEDAACVGTCEWNAVCIEEEDTGG